MIIHEMIKNDVNGYCIRVLIKNSKRGEKGLKLKGHKTFLTILHNYGLICLSSLILFLSDSSFLECRSCPNVSPRIVFSGRDEEIEALSLFNWMNLELKKKYFTRYREWRNPVMLLIWSIIYLSWIMFRVRLLKLQNSVIVILSFETTPHILKSKVRTTKEKNRSMLSVGYLQ